MVIEKDGGMMLMHLRIKQNLFIRGLRNSARECIGEDLLKECKNLSAAMGIKMLEHASHTIWKASEKEIKEMVTSLPKIKDRWDDDM